MLATLKDLPGKVNSIRFSRDGKRVLLASGITGAYGHAGIYDTDSGELLTSMVGHRDSLYAAVFSADEKSVATAGYDREIVLWDAATGEAIRNFSGHNGAIFDLDFSPDGKVLVSACADETVKVWNVTTGERLDTLSQPEGEVFAVRITPDGQFILAGSADNRLRVWRWVSKDDAQINPIVATRFVDESPLVNFELTPDGKALVVLTESGSVKVIDTLNWQQRLPLEPLDDMGSDLTISADNRTVTISLMNGQLARRELPRHGKASPRRTERVDALFLDLGDLGKSTEQQLRDALVDNPTLASAVADAREPDNLPLPVGRGVVIEGAIDAPGQSDLFQWQARAGEVWAIDADAMQDSPIDPIVSVLDESGRPVLRTRLQATRDSYFTFRGKDSKQVTDFRLFNWQEMNLGQYLYAAGEVTRLWMHPRGPDSGFNVYPGEGNRWTYFGTSHTTHALGEPAYLVRRLEVDEPPLANGLPVFDLYFENDDDPSRLAGKNSRLLFTAPEDGYYIARVGDTTGNGGKDFGYRLTLRGAEPSFKPSVQAANGALRKGSGREFTVRVDRFDGFDGEVTFDLIGLPEGIRSSAPVTIEAGQRFARGTIWVGEETAAWEGKISPRLVARAMVNGRAVERQVGPVGEFTLEPRPSVIASIHPVDQEVAENESWTLQVRRGETVSARVVLRRKPGFKNEVSFGKEDAGRNASQGVYVDNIGLNGLLVRAEQNERQFFLTADPTALPGRRKMFLKANVDGGVTTHPIVVEVLP